MIKRKGKSSYAMTFNYYARKNFIFLNDMHRFALKFKCTL